MNTLGKQIITIFKTGPGTLPQGIGTTWTLYLWTKSQNLAKCVRVHLLPPNLFPHLQSPRAPPDLQTGHLGAGHLHRQESRPQQETVISPREFNTGNWSCR